MKQVLKENIRLEVYPYAGFSNDSERILCECKSIEEQVKRHCDDVGSTDITWDITEICSFCGNIWEVYSKYDEKDNAECIEGMPTCCTQAEDEFKQEKLTEEIDERLRKLREAKKEKERQNKEGWDDYEEPKSQNPCTRGHCKDRCKEIEVPF